MECKRSYPENRRMLRLTGLFSAAFFSAAWAANHAPVVTQLPAMIVYVKEPVRLTLRASDPDLDPLSWSVGGLPAGAAIAASTGRFTWTPTMADTGAHTAAFTVSDGSSTTSMNVGITVVMPALAAGEATRVLRPNGGETYRYGDTITIAFVTLAASQQAQVFIQTGTSYRKKFIYTPQYEDRLLLDGDTLDARGIACRYYYSFPDAGVNLGFYRLALRDTIIESFINFGGDSVAAESLKVAINDPYGEDATTKVGDMSDAFFSVASNDHAAIRAPFRRELLGSTMSAPPAGTRLYDLKGARAGGYDAHARFPPGIRIANGRLCSMRRR